MCPLDDILDEGSKFQYSMLISFPQFIQVQAQPDCGPGPEIGTG